MELKLNVINLANSTVQIKWDKKAIHFKTFFIQEMYDLFQQLYGYIMEDVHHYGS